MNTLPPELVQLTLSYLAVQDLLPSVPQCCHLLNEAVWGEGSDALLWREMNLDRQTWRPTKFVGRQSVLIHACSNAHVNARHVTTLIRGGAGIHHIDSMGWNALTHAVYNDRADIARILLDAGADVYARTWCGNMAEQFARDITILKMIQAKKHKDIVRKQLALLNKIYNFPYP